MFVLADSLLLSPFAVCRAASSISRKLSGQGGHWRAAPGNGLGTNAPAAVCQAPKPGRAAGHGITQGKRKRTLQALEQSSQTEYVVIPRKKTAPSEPDKAMLTDRQREVGVLPPHPLCGHICPYRGNEVTSRLIGLQVLERQRAGLQREGFKFYMSLDPASQACPRWLLVPAIDTSAPRRSAPRAKGASVRAARDRHGAKRDLMQ